MGMLYSPLWTICLFLTTLTSLSFASITATLMHAFLYFRKQIWVQARRSMHEQADIHARLMSRYPQGKISIKSSKYLITDGLSYHSS